MDKLTIVKTELEPFNQRLKTHPLYTQFNTVNDIQIFMQYHVFAVWDFMSLLKALQHHLSTLTIPWIPAKNPTITRFINEIVIGEESDLDERGNPKSHFEMYIDAMNQIGADTSIIQKFIQNAKMEVSVSQVIQSSKIQNEVKEFLNFTFDIINTNKPHKIASAFTFGRENIIPDMFIEIVKKVQEQFETPCDKLIYYLKRHIEIDGDEHGPLSLEMIQILCGEDEIKWQECIDVAKQALKLRFSLWNAVLHQLTKSNQVYA